MQKDKGCLDMRSPHLRRLPAYDGGPLQQGTARPASSFFHCQKQPEVCMAGIPSQPLDMLHQLRRPV